MKPVIIFGAGARGKYVYDIIQPWNHVAFFADNNIEKVGKTYRTKKILSFDEMKELSQDYDVLLSTNIPEMEEQLSEQGISYWCSGRGKNNYFDREEIMEARDLYILDQFMNNTIDIRSLYPDNRENWYREDFWSESNRKIISMMKNQTFRVDEVYDEIYAYAAKNCGGGYVVDYARRPGFRLAYRLIEQNIDEIRSICDVGCGYGALVQRLHNKFGKKVSVSALDGSSIAVEYLRQRGIAAYNETIENNSQADETYDIVTVFEVLEHVQDIGKAIIEIKRILKTGGTVLASVPHGKCCDCNTHVRQFTENILASCFVKEGFQIVNVQRIPDTNEDYLSHIMLEAVKL